MKLERKIKEVIINRLDLQVSPDDIADDAAIFSGGKQGDLGGALTEGFDLDSIDALEVVVALNKEFKVTITDQDMNIFQSINTISDYIRKNSPVADQYE